MATFQDIQGTLVDSGVPSSTNKRRRAPDVDTSEKINNHNYSDLLMDDILEQQQQQHPQPQQHHVDSSKTLKRKCVDYHTSAVVDISSRLYVQSVRSRSMRLDTPYLQPHSSYISLMGLPISRRSSPDPSSVYCTHMAHVTRAKNSSAVMCLSWTPGGRRLLTGNYEGEFTLWDGMLGSFWNRFFGFSVCPFFFFWLTPYECYTSSLSSLCVS